jgi:hypothetical protein
MACVLCSAALGQSPTDATAQHEPTLVPLELKLPKPAFKGTPKNAPKGTMLEPARKGPRPMPSVPPGVLNLALNKPVRASDEEPIVGTLKMVTDGEKEAVEGGYVELGPGKQWVQIDLGEQARIYAIVVWHYHMNARIYHDVIVQVSSSEGFEKSGTYTVFHNDHDDSSGLGVGKDREYWDTYEGRLIDVRQSLERYGAPHAAARYIRLYSNGSTFDDLNHYTEVEVYGLPAE